jgi:hopanoid biosynthesis associated protein HpnK
MGSAEGARRLIVTADDFGRSRSINQAVLRAHRQGILTSASLLVNGEAVEEAVEIARANPTLAVGLHLCLVRGRSTLSREEIPDLISVDRWFSDQPVCAGLRYFFNTRLRAQLAREIEAQFKKYRVTGLPLDHVNGHLHLHLHPTVLQLVLERTQALGVRAMRLTNDPFGLNLRLAKGQWFYRLSHACVFHFLSRHAGKAMRARQVRHPAAVFGLLQSGRADEEYLCALLARLPAGDSELYSHPSLDESKAELDAFTSARAKELVRHHHIQLIRYQDL